MGTDDKINVYLGDIVKSQTEVLDDGTLMVYGKAAGPDVDLDGQICDPKWLARAVPDWMSWGNVREQHGTVAAGVGKVLTASGDDWMLKAHIVDPVTVKKIQTGVLKGFSVGIRGYRTVTDPNAPKGRIVDGIIPEISVVDRPCNPTAVMSIAKAAGGSLAPVDQAGVTITLPDVDPMAGVDPWAWVADLDDTSKAALSKALGVAPGTIVDSGTGRAPTGDLPDTVKALITEARAEDSQKIEKLMGQLNELSSKLDKALSMPAPGGPVIHAPTQQTPPATAHTDALAKAAGYRATAARATDPAVRAQYEAEAARLEQGVVGSPTP